LNFHESADPGLIADAAAIEIHKSVDFDIPPQLHIGGDSHPVRRVTDHTVATSAGWFASRRKADPLLPRTGAGGIATGAP
jgi:hypothetical protein